MMDPSRWIMVEAWFSLGLRIEWIASWELQPLNAHLQMDTDNRRFIYKGNKTWAVAPPGYGSYQGADDSVPQLSTLTMVHEMAHYLVATEEQRRHVNFGMKANHEETIEMEARAAMAEKAIDAMLKATANIATMAMGGKPK